MIRTALFACALVAIPSAALAQTQTVLPEVRMLRAPAAAQADGPPAGYIQGMAPEYDGWIYQDIPGSPGGGNVRPVTTLYLGVGYPATVMVCAKARSVLMEARPRNIVVAENRCATITTDDVRVSPASLLPDHPPIQIRYRILAIHRAAD